MVREYSSHDLPSRADRCFRVFQLNVMGPAAVAELAQFPESVEI